MKSFHLLSLLLILILASCNSQAEDQATVPRRKRIVVPEHAFKGPFGVPVFEDYELAKAYAIENNKPLLVNYTAYTSVQCRMMEDKIWSKPEISKILQEDLVVAMLYTDDKMPLPEEKQFTTEYASKVTNKGQYWTSMLTTKYKTVTVPLYVMLDQNEKELGKPMAYVQEQNAKQFESWLQSGISKYHGK